MTSWFGACIILHGSRHRQPTLFRAAHPVPESHQANTNAQTTWSNSRLSKRQTSPHQGLQYWDSPVLGLSSKHLRRHRHSTLDSYTVTSYRTQWVRWWWERTYHDLNKFTNEWRNETFWAFAIRRIAQLDRVCDWLYRVVRARISHRQYELWVLNFCQYVGEPTV